MTGDLFASAHVPVLHCFVTGCEHDGRGGAFYTAIAVGSHGRFVGGACGRTHSECWAALRRMERVFRERWSEPFILLWSMGPSVPDVPESPPRPLPDALVALRAALALQEARP